MQIDGEKEIGLGRELREKGRVRSFYCFLNYRFCETAILDWIACSMLSDSGEKEK